MWVCICNRINERAVNDVLDDVSCVRDIYDTLSMGIRCGACYPKMKEMFDNHLDRGVKDDNTMHSDL